MYSSKQELCQEIEENYTQKGSPQTYIMMREGKKISDIPWANTSPDLNNIRNDGHLYSYKCNCTKNKGQKFYFKTSKQFKKFVEWSDTQFNEACSHIQIIALKEKLVMICENKGKGPEDFSIESVEYRSFCEIIYQRILKCRSFNETDTNLFPTYTIKNKNNEWSCTCKGFHYHSHCKHIKLTQQEEAHKQAIRELGISLALKCSM